MRKLLAILLSAVMLMPEVYAEPLVNNNVSSENEGTEIIDGGVITEDPISEVVTDTEEDETPVTEATENAAPVVTTPAEDTSDETVTEEQNTPVLLADEGVQSRTVTYLSLAVAKEFTVTNESGMVNVLTVTEDGRITVNGGPGLILLSNVNPNEYANSTIILNGIGTGWDVTVDQSFSNGNTYSFQGLGSNDYPYAGTMSINNDTYSVTANSALFSYLSTDATLPSNIKFMMEKKESDQTTGPILLADQIKKGSNSSKPTLECNIIITADTGDNAATDATIGGIIDSMQPAASVSLALTNNLTGTLTVSGGNNRGLFCNTMESGSSLSATLTSAGNISVTATTGDAGGFVGKIKDGGTLTATGKAVNSITANNGNAGGLIGSAINSVVLPLSDSENTNAENKSISFSNIDVTTKKQSASAGGLIGEYVTNSDQTLYLDHYGFDNVTLSASSGFGGGVFGNLRNTNGELTINGTSVISSKGNNVYSFGGLVGNYSAVYLNSALTINGPMNVTSIIENGNNGFGGIIGKMMNSCYVKMSNMTVTVSGSCGKFGGLVARIGEGTPALLDAANVTVTGEISSSSDRGGLVGELVKGVLRLSDTTTINTSITADTNRGIIIGKNGYGLVYGIQGWSLDTNNKASNIGNWGEVIRLGGELSDEGSLVEFNSTTHTITVKNGNPGTIDSTDAFAGYALAFNYGGTLSPVLSFNNPIDSSSYQTVSLNSNIDLTNTGILGVGRDNGSGNSFQGQFDGKGHSITMDIGGNAGILCVNGDAHSKVALLSSVSGASTDIKGLTINGNIIVTSILKDNKTFYVAGLVGLQNGIATYDNVTVDCSVRVKKLDNNSNYGTVHQGGLISWCANATNTEFKNCSWTSELTTERNNNNDCMGGFLAFSAGNININSSNCKLTGVIRNNASIARVGGFVAELNRYENKGTIYKSSIIISDMTVSDTIETNATSVSGGFLGCHWYNTDVQFGLDADGENTSAKGVTIDSASLKTNTAQFGGLVYQATGHWDATRSGSIIFTGTADNKTTITGSKGNYRGLIIGDGLYQEKKEAIYLEVGTWGNNYSAFYIDREKINLTLTGSGNFDELVGNTIIDKSGNDNGIVSLWSSNDPQTAKIDVGDTCTTYISQLGQTYTNGNTRYYYNLSHEPVDANLLNNSQKVTTWSASQFAAGNIRNYLCSNPGFSAKITGSIDLKGYSYYPITPLGDVNVGDGTNVTTLAFDYEEMNGKETGNKLYNSNNQHNLMQHGLLYNSNHNIVVNKVLFSGNVGKQATNQTNKYNSGTLVFGNSSGNTTTSPITVRRIQLNNIILAGVRVTGVSESTEYAPLLINTISEAVTLSVDTLSTGTGYVGDVYAATSLVGNVGSGTAIRLTLTFSNLALDARKQVGSSTSINNNGNESYKIEYNTTHSIFNRATLLESFRYASDSSGVYNFNSTDTMVTFGVEISNTDSGRNIDKTNKQYKYYNDGYVWDGIGNAPTDAETIKTYFTNDKYLRYVYISEGENDGFHELDINQKATNLKVGCGTYGDPYIITDGSQLIDLAKFINNSTTVSDFQVTFNSDVIATAKQLESSYHTKGNDQGKDISYTWNGTKWIKEDRSDAPDEVQNNALLYLLNAYYKIDTVLEISLTSDEYQGLGSQDNPFSGVITGNIVRLTGNPSAQLNFGGLIRYSRGSVVKDLTVDYSSATITMNNTGIAGNKNVNPFFGGVVGYCLGGDTIIDNVSVTYSTNSINLSGDKQRMIASGGYVGLVGGAKDSTGFEKTGGGVIFRNMNNHINTFTTTLSYATEILPTVIPDNVNYSTNLSYKNYFFCNPYVGRVLDGYVCYDNPNGIVGTSTLNNTDKNYTIPDVVTEESEGLTVSTAESGLDVTVSSAQGLWLLSAIINSGATAMDANGYYQDYDSSNGSNRFVDAYQYGKVRSVSYDGIGTDIAEKGSALSDEAYWGGIASEFASDLAKARVSYLIKQYTSGTLAAYLTGRSTTTGGNAQKNGNKSVALSFSNNINMTAYGNGFRGIGASYTKGTNLWTNSQVSIPENYRRSMLVSSINKDSSDVITITLNMNQREYHEGGQQDPYEKGFWNTGAGLFPALSYTDGAQVKNIEIGGTVCFNTFHPKTGMLSTVQKKTYDLCVGAFAGFVANAKDTINFDNVKLTNLHVYGGTTTGGVFGITSGNPININSFQINDVDVIKTVTTDGSIGGLIGLKRAVVNIGSDETRSDIRKLTVKMYGTKTQSQSCGGLVGCSDGGNTTIKNISAESLTVHGEDVRDIGGLISGIRQNGTLTLTNCQLTDLSVSYKANTTDNNGTSFRNVGGVLGYSEVDTIVISNVRINSGAMTVENGNSLGGYIGCTTVSAKLQDCSISGSLYMSGRSQPYTGGYIGRSNATTTIQMCKAENMNILSGDNDAGGLIGKMSNGSTAVSNVSLSNVKVATKKQDKYVGVLTGDTNGKTFNGYNILADSCSIGYNTNATVESLGSISLNNDKGKTGLWFGNSSGTSTLVAVAVKGNILPRKEVGSGAANIVYADYPVIQSNETNSVFPYLDVNPTISLDDLTLTGNGVGYKTESSTELYYSVSYSILEEANKGGDNRIYFNLSAGTETEIAKFLPDDQGKYSNDVYLTTYQDEETGNTDVPTNVNFPILVVGGLAKTDEEIWNYIAALTNVANGTIAKSQAASVTATTYKWESTSSSSSFVAVDGTTQIHSATVVNDKTIKIASNAYDNQQSQFTLLTVKYKNPTTTSTENLGDYFILHVPILVKKVMYASLNVKLMAGTNYYDDNYKPFVSDSYATAGFGEPVTAYIEYNYDRSKSDWQTMLDNGDNLLWNYNKVLDLAKSATGDILLPDGTLFTLVDKQTEQVYYHQFTNMTEENASGDNVHQFDLSTMTTYGTEDTSSFKPVPICDLLGLSASKNNTSGTYVVESDMKMATVKVGNTYYRKGTDDEAGDRYEISLGSNLTDNKTGTNYLPVGEGYYLTIQIPSTKGVTDINNKIDYYSPTMEGSGSNSAAPLARIKSSNPSSYVVYDGVQQAGFKISTEKIGSSSDTIMSDGDSIQVTLSSTLGLTEIGKVKFAYYKPAELDHQFNVNLKKYLKAESGDTVSDVLIGAEGASYSYTITSSEATDLWDPVEVTEVQSATMEKLTINCGKNNAQKIAEYFKEHKEGILTIQAVITLPYPTVGSFFPGRNTDDDPSGISVVADSRVATATTQLPITQNKKTIEDEERYYTQNPSEATLIYNTYDGYGTGDDTRKLGVNPSDTTNDLSRTIYTSAVYNYANVDPSILNNARSIKYSMQLFQKQEDGSYGNALENIDEYLPSVTEMSHADGQEIKTLIKTKEFTQDVTKSDTLNIQITPLTGDAFEKQGFIYSNYKVVLTAVLLDSQDNELAGTKASDYIVYTNARIYQRIIDATN